MFQSITGVCGKPCVWELKFIRSARSFIVFKAFWLWPKIRGQLPLINSIHDLLLRKRDLRSSPTFFLWGQSIQRPRKVGDLQQDTWWLGKHTEIWTRVPDSRTPLVGLSKDRWTAAVGNLSAQYSHLVSEATAPGPAWPSPERAWIAITKSLDLQSDLLTSLSQCPDPEEFLCMPPTVLIVSVAFPTRTCSSSNYYYIFLGAGGGLTYLRGYIRRATPIPGQ